jgi:hypothetical protein
VPGGIISPASSRVGRRSASSNFLTRATAAARRTAAASAWQGQRAGSIGYDSQSGPRDAAARSSTNGLSQDDLRLIFGFPGLFEAEPVTDEWGQPIPGQFRLGTTDSMDIMGEGYRLGGRYPTTNNSSLRNTTQNARLLQGLTVKQALGFLYSLNEDELTKFQVQLFNAGMFGGDKKPTWGVLDEHTREAFTNLMGDLVNNPDLTVGETLDRATRGFGQEMANQMKGEDGRGGSGKGQQEILLQPEVTDGQTLADMIDTIMQDQFGRDATKAEKDRLVPYLQDKQREEFMATTYRQAQIDIKNGRPTTPGEAGSELEAFMNAIIGQESGGDANITNTDSGAWGLGQIMPENWVPWNREAGTDPNDRSAANQRRVIAFKMQQYYQQFGNWRDVAIAWYGGPGAVSYSNKDAPQGGYPSINSYADQAMARFNSLKGTAGTSSYQDPMLSVEFRDKLDLGAEAKAVLRAANPAEYEGHRFQKAAQTFMSLLAGI